MFSIVMFVDSDEASYVKKSIDDIRGFKYKNNLDSIIIVSNCVIDDVDDIEVVKYTNKYKTYNEVCRKLKSKYIIFCCCKIKVTEGWADDIVHKLEHDNNSIVNPTIYALNARFWSNTGYGYNAFGFRWNMNVVARYDNNNVITSPCCFAMSRIRLYNIDMFDDNMSTDCAITELSIRNRLLGGTISSVACGIGCDWTITYNHIDAMRIVEQWLPAYSSRFYNFSGIDHSTDIDRDSFKSFGLYHKQQISSDEILKMMPENDAFFDLYGIASKKKIGIVSDGPSIDHIHNRDLLKYDILIGVNCSALQFKCDYAICNDISLASLIVDKYRDTKLIMPYNIIDISTGKYLNITDIFNDCISFQLWYPFIPIDNINDCIINYENMSISAVHIAMIMGNDITLIGCDNRFINNRCVSKFSMDYNFSGIEPSDSVNRLFTKYENALRCLSELAIKNNICIYRHNIL